MPTMSPSETGTRAPARLLPGDRAPDLPLARILNSETEPEITFDRTSVVVLWSVGCGGCLPAIERLSVLADAYSLPLYCVAVRVLDIEVAAEKARSSSANVVFAAEAPGDRASYFRRGPVARNWQEASGLGGVPAAFVVNGDGVVVWLGWADGLAPVLPAIVKDEYSIEEFRRAASLAISNLDVVELRTRMDVHDASFAGDQRSALALIRDTEARYPDIAVHSEFWVTKLSTLLDAEKIEEALATYLEHPRGDRSSADAEARCASFILHDQGSRPDAIEGVVGRLTAFDRDHFNGSPPDDAESFFVWLQIQAQLAIAVEKLGDRAKSGAMIEKSLHAIATSKFSDEEKSLGKRIIEELTQQEAALDGSA